MIWQLICSGFETSIATVTRVLTERWMQRRGPELPGEPSKRVDDQQEGLVENGSALQRRVKELELSLRRERQKITDLECKVETLLSEKAEKDERLGQMQAYIRCILPMLREPIEESDDHFRGQFHGEGVKQ